MEVGEQATTLRAQEAAKFKEPIGGGKRDRTPCPDGQHDWECNKTGCANCWDPPCEPNRKKEQDAHDALHQSEGQSPEQRKAAYQNKVQEELDAGKDPVGLAFERDVLNSLKAEDILFYSYKAHCTKCHVQAEIDFVTKTAVMECKNSPKGFDLDQMKTRVISIAQKCFPGKKITCVTRKASLDKLEGKLKQWKKHLPVEPATHGV